MRRLAATLMLLAFLCGGGAAAESVLLDATAPESTRVGQLTYRGGLILEFDDKRFGGLSAIEVAPNGTVATVLSDRGHWLELHLSYDDNGDLTSAELAAAGPLLGTDGEPLRGWRNKDSEGLVRLADGSRVVSLERNHHLLRYPPAARPFAQPPTHLALPPGITSAPANGGMEAVTALADGRLLVLAEDLVAFTDETTDWGAAWVGDGHSWAPLAYALTSTFKPSDAARLPNGDVIVLERHGRLLSGFVTRLVRVPATEVAAGARLRGEELGRIEPPMISANFEGIATRIGPAGETLVYLVSDDNFLPFWQTYLLLFELKP